MRITTVTIGFGATQSLPEYSNVKPTCTLSAEVAEGEDPAAVAAQLQHAARQLVEAEIDNALEYNGRPARYSTEPRYQVIHTGSQWLRRKGNGPQVKCQPPEHLVIILPNELRLESASDQWWSHLYGASRKVRHGHALRAAEEYIADNSEKSWRLIDASDGDLSKVPAWVLESAVAPEEPEPALITAKLTDHDGNDLGDDDERY